MTYPRRPEDGPWHERHSCQPNTDPALISAFVLANHMIHCPVYLCFMRGDVCQQRRAEAFKVKRRSVTRLVNYKWATDEWQRLGQCVECKSYYKPAPQPVPAKHGLCSCGCGREGRLVGRGMLSGCYQKYRKGKVCSG